MLPDRVLKPGPLTYESGALPIALRGPATGLLHSRIMTPNIQEYLSLIFIKTNPYQPSIILEVNFSTQLQPIRSLIGVL